MYQKFKQLLLERDTTAYAVSKETGISTATLSSWKNGHYTPKLDKIQILADYFNVPITYLLDEEESNEHIKSN